MQDLRTVLVRNWAPSGVRHSRSAEFPCTDVEAWGRLNAVKAA
jgi:hypothetical protein